MFVIKRIAENYDRVKRDGFLWLSSRAIEMLKEIIIPPWLCLYWLPVQEAADLLASSTVRDRLDRSLLNSVELRVVRSLGELNTFEYQALLDSIGESAVPEYDQRLSQGIELHILFADKRVAGTLFFVFGKTHRFQHVILTERDAMALDGRIDPKYRGRRLYSVLISLSIQSLKQSGIERLFIDTAADNDKANRSYVSIGFRFLLKYKARRGRYRFDRSAI